MKIDYVILSSDDNPLYKDFYDVVSKQWNKLGFKTYYINITNIDEIVKTKFGVIHKIKSLDFVSTGFQSQVVRLFASNFINGNMLTSDIDMLPLNGDYFNQFLNEISKNNILLYSGQPYSDVPYYPMCYALGHSDTFKKYLNIGDISFEEYCKMLLSDYGEKWNTDENFMYDRLQNFKENLIIKKRNMITTRIDRSKWEYNDEMLKLGHYIDSHLLRPYSQHKNEIDKILY